MNKFNDLVKIRCQVLKNKYCDTKTYGFKTYVEDFIKMELLEEGCISTNMNHKSNFFPLAMWAHFLS
jgi:hypothetical protein